MQMKVLRCCIAIALFCFLYAVGSNGHAAEIIIIKIILNAIDKGDYFVLRSDEGGIFITPMDLDSLGLKRVAKGKSVLKDGSEYVSLHTLSPKINVKLDAKAAELQITAPPELFEENILDMSRRKMPQATPIVAHTAFVNYDISWGIDTSFSNHSLSIPFEAGFNANGWLGLTKFSYSKIENDERFVRLQSSLIYDEVASFRRYIYGDFSASSGNLGSGGLFGGVSINKNYTLAPYVSTSPGLNLSGTIDTASEVEIYVNGMLVQRETLPPGYFDLMNLPVSSGAGVASLVIKDTFGREQTIIVPYYLTPSLLKKGLHEYSYNLGFFREEYGVEDNQYGDLVLLGFHRYGLFDWLTAGLRAEAGGDMVNLGGSMQFSLLRAGSVDTSIAFSQEDGRTGFAGFAHYSYIRESFNTAWMVRGFSRDYANLNLDRNDDKIRMEESVSFGFRLGTFGSVSLRLSHYDRYEETGSRGFSLYYTKNLSRNISLLVRAGRNESEGKTSDNIFLGLNYYWGKGKSANLSCQTGDDLSYERAEFIQTPPLGPGMGYRFALEHAKNAADNSDVKGGGFVEYHGKHNNFRASFRKNVDSNDLNLGVSGSLLYIERNFYLSRPVYDGFALVQVDELDDVGVLLNNQIIGYTNHKGEFLLPRLHPYISNKISIDSNDIPIDYKIGAFSKEVSPPYRGGGVVSFEIKKLQAFVGKFIIISKKATKPAEYWGLKMKVNGGSVESIIGKRGTFYLENIQPGKYPATLFRDDEECSFNILIPESKATMVEMGEVICEMD